MGIQNMTVLLIQTWGGGVPSSRISSPRQTPMPLPAAREYEGGHRSGSRPHQRLLSACRLRAAAPRRGGKGPEAPGFGAAGAHVSATGAWRTQRPLRSHSTASATMPCPSLHSQVPPPPPSAGSAVSTETSLPLPHAPHAASSEWLKILSVCKLEPMTTLGDRTTQDALPSRSQKAMGP